MFQFLIVFSIFISGFSHAAISKKASLSRRPSSILMGEGSIKGGKAGTGFTLLSLQSKVAKSKRAERLSIDMGNGAAQKLEGSVAYFNVQNDPKSKRIIIDFSQTLNSKFENMHLKKIFAKSPFVNHAEIIFESQSQTMSLVLTLNKAAGIRAMPIKGTKQQTAKLVLDIFEPSLKKTALKRNNRKI